MTVLWVATQFLASWLLADFITGIFHWFEDRYLDETTSLEFFQGVAQDNKQHHTFPTALCMVTWWENMRSAALFAWPTAVVLLWLGAPLWLWLGVACSSFGNLIHRFSHEPKRKLPRFIRFMQWTGLFISHEHHALHHYTDGVRVDPKWTATKAYCPMTNWVNPLLDNIRFWRGLERALLLLNIKPLQ